MRLLMLALVGAVALMALLWFLQRRLIYFPVREVPSPRSVGLKEVEEARFAASDGVALHGWFAPAWEPRRGLAAHGSSASIRATADSACVMPSGVPTVIQAPRIGKP